MFLRRTNLMSEPWVVAVTRLHPLQRENDREMSSGHVTLYLSSPRPQCPTNPLFFFCCDPLPGPR